MPLSDYPRETWQNNVTAANATRMNNIESGLDAVTDAVRFSVVDTISALKSQSVSGLTSGERREVLGYYAANDGGGGAFRYNSSSSATDDGGMVIAPNTGSGRWERIHPRGEVDVRWFGAKGDYTTNDSPAIQKAFDFFGQYESGIIWVPPGLYVLGSTVYTPNEKKIRVIGHTAYGGPSGTGNETWGSAFVAKTNITRLFHIGRDLTDVGHMAPAFYNLNFRDDTAARSNILVEVKFSNYWTFRECTFVGGSRGLYINGLTADAAWGLADQCFFDNNTYGVYLDEGGFVSQAGAIFLRNSGDVGIYQASGAQVRINGLKVDGTSNNTGVWLKGIGGQVVASDFEQCNPGIKFDATTGTGGDNGLFNKAIGCNFTTSTGNSIVVTSLARKTDLIGNGMYFTADADDVSDAGYSTFRIDSETAGTSAVSSDRGNASVTMSLADTHTQRFNTPLTAARNCDLPPSSGAASQMDMTPGMTYRIIRGPAATGAFNLNIRGDFTIIKSLTTAGTWAEFTYHATDGYVQTAGGTL